MLGATIGSYVIERELGAGGMGVVYVGKHQLLGRTAAIKVLLPKYSQDEDIVQRFFNEARAATAIKHPGIVEVYDFGHSDGAAYIVMELCDGESLAVRIRRDREMPVTTALALARHIAGALAAAHKTGIVHRDLKPDNVFVVADPEVAGGERIKLLDFGIAKLATDVAGPAKTSTGVIMGTPYYMSPEQCRGAGQVDHRSDLYSLGCILFELVCGRVPFLGEGAGDIIGAHLLTPPPSPTSFAPALPADVERLILALLAKKPADRPDSAEAVIAELHRLAGSLPPTLRSARIAAIDTGIAPTLHSDRVVDAGAATAPATDEVVAKTTGDGAAAATAPAGSTPVGASDHGAHTPTDTAIDVRDGVVSTVSGAAREVTRPPRRTRAVIASVAGLALAGAIAFAVTRDRADETVVRTTPTVADAGVADANVIAIVDVAPDVGARLVIGTIEGDGMTDSLRDKIRPRIAALVANHAPDIRPVLEPGDGDIAAGKAGHAVHIEGLLVSLDVRGKELQCQFKLTMSTFPDRSVFGFLSGGAKVTEVTTSVKGIELAAADCVDAVLEELARKILPVLRDKLGLPARDPPVATTPKPAPKPTAPATPDAQRTVVETHLAGAQRELAKQNWEAAREHYQAVAAGTYRRAEGLYGLARVAFETKQPDALELATRAVTGGAGLRARLLRGHLHFKQGNYDDALADYEAVLKVEPTNAEARRAVEEARRRRP